MQIHLKRLSLSLLTHGVVQQLLPLVLKLELLHVLVTVSC